MAIKAEKRAKALPYVAAAFVCEKVIVEGDQTPSFMRMIDQITIAAPAGSRVIGTVLPLNTSLIVAFRAAGNRGTMPLRVECIAPSKKKSTFFEAPVTFEGTPEQEEAGTTLAVGMHVQWDGEGVYWFDVFLDGKWRTSIPLRISMGTSSPPMSVPGKAPREPKS